jgi:hypothetical protein
MAVKTLDNHIKQAFLDLGFSEDEIKNGCWLLTRENKSTGEEIKVAWIALHKFLERAAIMAGITFDKPEIFNLQPTEIAIFVNGKKGDLSAWAIGEASDLNLTKLSKAYRWAMAEKRAKDRVILKLLGISGDMYSEEEADEFKEKRPEKTDFEKDASKEKASNTKALHKAVAEGVEYQRKEPEKTLEDRYNKAIVYLNSQTQDSFKLAKPSVIDSINNLVTDLTNKGCSGWAEKIQSKFNELSDIENFDFNFNNQELKDYRV